LQVGGAGGADAGGCSRDVYTVITVAIDPRLGHWPAVLTNQRHPRLRLVWRSCGLRAAVEIADKHSEISSIA
jgi:hypothetical protein